MKDSTSIWMHLLPQKDLKVFVLDHGMDIFVPVFIWPTPIKSIEINQNTLLMDMRITKNIFIKNDQKCESKEDYVYTGTYVVGRWYEYVILFEIQTTNCVAKIVLSLLQIVLLESS